MPATVDRNARRALSAVRWALRRVIRRTGSRTVDRAISLAISLTIAGAAGGPGVRAAEPEELDLRAMFQEGIPPSPFADPVYRYADAMLAHARDVYGPETTGLFLGALDRKTLRPLEGRPEAPAGVAEERRPGPRGGPLRGSNPQLDENLFRLLYFLEGLSGEARYREAADEALGWFLRSAAWERTGLYPWGASLSWDTLADEPASGLEAPVHELARPWLLWQRSFELAPDACRRFALALRDAHGPRAPAGSFSPRADPVAGAPLEGPPDLRHAGFLLRTWAEAHARTGDRAFLDAVEDLLGSLEPAVIAADGAEPGASPQGSFLPGSFPPTSSVSLAIDSDGAARRVPEPLRTRLGRLAAREDGRFLSLPHDPRGAGGFRTRWQPAEAPAGRAVTPLWSPVAGGETTARVAMMCVSRYENTGSIAYRELALAAADAYLEALPGDDVDAWAGTFGLAISLELAAFRIAAREEYFRRAFHLGEVAIERLFGDSPLPRASLRTDHYESTTGADTLVLALAELHLAARQITAVRAPPNTIDR